MADKLVLLDVGEQALNNPSAGGILVKPSHFRTGDSDLYPNSTNHTNIVGNFVTGGVLHHVESLSAKAMRFVMDIDTRTLLAPTTIKEIVVFLEGNIALARAVFKKPYVLEPGEPVRMSIILATSRADLTTIDVSVGEYDSIPSSAFIYRLPSPGTTEFNAITVLNGMRNPDGTNSPVLAMRYGAGAFQWAFTGHMRVFNGVPVSATDTSFKLANQSGYAADEQVLVHVVSGSGEGMSRRYRFNAGASEFRDVDNQPIPNLNACTIAVWKMQVSSGSGGGSGGGIIPPTENIPQDWVLTPGPEGDLSWQPPKPASRIVSTLFVEPSRLDVNALNFVGTGETGRFSTGSLVAENANYIYPSLGGASQHRTAFSLHASEIDFLEDIASTVPVDLRVFTKSPSTGTRIEIEVKEYEGDGAQVEFQLDDDVESPAHIFAFVASTLQPTTSYVFDSTTKRVRFTGPPDAGLPIELRAIRYVQETGYSTRIVTKTFQITGETLFLQLPVAPQNIENVFLSHSGAHVHQANYQIVEDALILTSSLLAGYEAEVVIFENVQSAGTAENGLNGIVVDGYYSNKNLVLLRHGANPLELPIPKPNIMVGPGMKISEKGDATLLELDVAALGSAAPPQSWSTRHNLKDNATILATQRIDITRPMKLIVTCDFAARLGPGYEGVEGTESMEYIIGVRSSTSKEPDFGREIRGSESTGLITAANSKAAMAYANASMTQIFNFDPVNHPAGFVEIVAKMRVNNANTAQFATRLTINFNALELPL